jgi:hypothetical protein
MASAPTALTFRPPTHLPLSPRFTASCLSQDCMTSKSRNSHQPLLLSNSIMQSNLASTSSVLPFCLQQPSLPLLAYCHLNATSLACRTQPGSLIPHYPPPHLLRRSTPSSLGHLLYGITTAPLKLTQNCRHRMESATLFTKTKWSAYILQSTPCASHSPLSRQHW